MASGGGHVLPADLLHLIANELGAAKDYGTLYNCVISSKQIANSGAIAALYRICHDCPIISGGSEAMSSAVQEINIKKWSILWRTITLSALGKTLYPYVRHLRELALRDLSDLLERLDEPKFAHKIAKLFFAGEMKRFQVIDQSPTKGRAGRLLNNSILHAIGDVITQQAPLLEGISEPGSLAALADVLAVWAPRLGNLRELELSEGKVLADSKTRNMLHAYCPKLHQLRMLQFTGDEPDHHLAQFISGLQPNTLTTLVAVSNCGIGPETLLALNEHGKSLRDLRIALDEEGLLSLGILQQCTHLKSLQIESLGPTVDMKEIQTDAYVQIVEWLKRCNQLRQVTLIDIVSAPDLLFPLLLNEAVRLHELCIQAKEASMYIVRDHHDFHEALAGQTSLRSLSLDAGPEDHRTSDIDALVEAFCSLKELRFLHIPRVSESFTDENIIGLAESLPSLEVLTVGSDGVSDAVLRSLGRLQNLKQVTFTGVTTFSAKALCDFVEDLGPGNEGILFSTELADPDMAIADEAQARVEAAFFQKVKGRFEYALLRDPNASDYESGDSD